MTESMNPLRAVSIAGNVFEEDFTLEESLEAWQYIYDHRLYLQMEGFYGRALRDLINEGLIDV